MPHVLWPLFWYKRELFNYISKLAADSILTFAKSKNLHVAVFTALHSFGRDLKRNVHVHLSTTTVGMTTDFKHLRSIFFPLEKL